MKSTKAARGRNGQLERVLRVMRDLMRMGGTDLHELAERYGTNVKTIRRDLEAIQAAGLQVEPDEEPAGKKKRWKLDVREDRLGRVNATLDASHYLALKVVMADAGAVARESGLYATLEDLLEKIERSVGEKGRARLEAVEAAFLPWEKHPYIGAPPERIWPLVEAIQGHRVCRVTYRAAGAGPGAPAREHEVLPLKLFVHDRAVYLVCRFEARGAVGTLNLYRVEALAVTERTAEPPADFDPAAWSETAFGIVPGERLKTYVLRFAPEVAAYIREREWHRGQTLQELPGGGVELTFRCAESWEVESWIAGWRGWVEVRRSAPLSEATHRLPSGPSPGGRLLPVTAKHVESIPDPMCQPIQMPGLPWGYG